jgi:hypothetical protein
MDQGPCSIASSCLASQEILRLLWCPKIHYCHYKSLPLAHILSRTTPSHHISARSISISPPPPQPKPSLPSGHFSSDLPTNILYAFLISLLHSTRAADLIILDFLILIFVTQFSPASRCLLHICPVYFPKKSCSQTSLIYVPPVM